MSGRFSRFVANVRFNVYGQLLQAVLPFFVIPFVIGRLGNEAYALYCLIGVLAGQFNLLSFGAGPATVKFLAEFEARGEHDKARTLLGTSLVFYGATGLLGAAVILLLSPYAPRLFNISPALQPAAGFILACAAATFLVQFFGRTFQAVPQAMQRFEYYNAVETGCSLLNYAGVVVLLWYGYWVRALALWGVAVAAASLGLYLWATARLLPDHKPGLGYDPAMMRKVAGLGGYLFANQLAWSVLYQADKLVLGAFIPLTEVAYYLVAFNLAQKLFLVLNPVMPVLLPFASAIQGRGDEEALGRFYLSGTKLTMILVWPATVLAFCLGPSFLRLWLGADFAAHAGWPLRILALGTFLSAVPAFPYAVAQGAGRMRPSTSIYLVSVALAAALWPLLVPRLGVIGAAAAFLAAHGLHTFAFMTWANSRLMRLNHAALLRSLAMPLTLSIPLIILSWVLRDSLDGWLLLGGYAAASYAAYLLACRMCALSSDEDEKLSQALGSRWPRGRA